MANSPQLRTFARLVGFLRPYKLSVIVSIILTVAGVTVVLFVVNWRLALATTAIMPVLVGLAYRYSRVSHPVLRDVQQKMADVATVAEENIVGVHVVKAFAQEAQEERKFERASESVFGQSILANRQRAIYVPLLAFVPLLAQGSVLLYGGWMVVHGALT